MMTPAILEARVLLDGYEGPPPTASDDSAWTYHDQTAYGNVSENDSWSGTPSFVVTQQPAQGTLNLDPTTGAFSYIPGAGLTGGFTFVYRLSDAVGFVDASVTIGVSNEAPAFASTVEGESPEIELSSGDTLFSTDQIIGQLIATDLECDQLTFSGSSSPYISILPDGQVKVTDGLGLTSLLAESGGGVQIAVTVTDGLMSTASLFRLDALTGFTWGQVVQSEIYLEDTNGWVWEIKTGQELLEALQTMELAGETISSLIIKGHGWSGGIEVGNDGMALSMDDDQIDFGGTNITNLLRNVTSANSTIRLRGCHTYPCAKAMEEALDNGAVVYGAMRFVIAIPGTFIGIGIYN